MCSVVLMHTNHKMLGLFRLLQRNMCYSYCILMDLCQLNYWRNGCFQMDFQSTKLPLIDWFNWEFLSKTGTWHQFSLQNFHFFVSFMNIKSRQFMPLKWFKLIHFVSNENWPNASLYYGVWTHILHLVMCWRTFLW